MKANIPKTDEFSPERKKGPYKSFIFPATES